MFQDHNFLYVEDDPLSREVMSVIMRNAMGVQSLTMFHDSANFIDKLLVLPQKPDIILLDIHMKPDDGFALLKMLRRLPEYQYVRIIALTASVMNEEVEQLRTSGFDGAIAKPLSIHTFPDLMGRVLRGETVWHIA